MSTIEEAYIDQPMTLRLDTNSANLGTASGLAIVYRKPDGVEGSAPGSDDGTIIEASLLGSVVDKAGMWTFQTSAIFSGDTNRTLGETYLVRVKNEWER